MELICILGVIILIGCAFKLLIDSLTNAIDNSNRIKTEKEIADKDKLRKTICKKFTDELITETDSHSERKYGDTNIPIIILYQKIKDNWVIIAVRNISDKTIIAVEFDIQTLNGFGDVISSFTDSHKHIVNSGESHAFCFKLPVNMHHGDYCLSQLKRIQFCDESIVKYNKSTTIKDYTDLVNTINTKFCDISFVRFLVKQGVDIHSDDELALRLAVIIGKLDVVKYLVEQGADIHIKDDYILRCAISNGYLDIIKYLVEIGTNVEFNNSNILGIPIEIIDSKIIKFIKESDDTYQKIIKKDNDTNDTNNSFNRGFWPPLMGI